MSEKDEELESERLPVLLNLVVVCVLLPGNAVITQYGVGNIWRAVEEKQLEQQSRHRRSASGQRRRSIGKWSWFNLLAVSTLACNMVAQLAGFLVVVVAPLTIYGRGVNSAGALACSALGALFVLAIGLCYSGMILTAFERLVITFQHSSASLRISGRSQKAMYSAVLAMAATAIGVDLAILFTERRVLQLETSDVNPYKHSKKKLKVCLFAAGDRFFRENRVLQILFSCC